MELLNYIQKELTPYKCKLYELEKYKTIEFEALSINYGMSRHTTPIFEINNANPVETVPTGPTFYTATVTTSKDYIDFELGEIITVTLTVPGQASVMLVQAYLNRKESSYSSTTEKYSYIYDFICTDIIVDR